ncbi:MAG TPA: hypothetical protein VFV50_01045 [Bdellovibrionales bacterium]|nr:hypothetical protein [Bdellovibrionales bacterium]
MEFVVLVDECRASRILARAVFEELGCTVYEAGSVEEANAHVASKPVSLVVAAPRVGQTDYLKELRVSSHRPEIPFVFMALPEDVGTIRKLDDKIHDGYILRPVTKLRALDKLTELFPARASEPTRQRTG